jgi:hypothetical protein
MNRRNFIKTGALFVPATFGIFVPKVSAQSYLPHRRKAFVSTEFDPATYGTTALWLAARKETGFVNNDRVGTLLDWSGNSRTFTQGTADQKPTFLTARINSLPALSFAAATYALHNYMTAGDTLDIGSGGLTVMQVVKQTTATGYALSKWSTGLGQGWICGRYSNAFSSGYSGHEQAGADSSTSWRIVTTVMERGAGGSIKTYVDGALGGSYSGGSTTSIDGTYPLLLGGISNGTISNWPFSFTGEIAEVCVWPTNISVANREGAETALGNGVYGLTVTH